MTASFSLFPGNCPKNVSKDAKYAIRSGRTDAEVGLTYVSTNGERWFATTKDHPELVKMVNHVKTQMGSAPNGPFYINEYGQVLVPVGGDAKYYLAGDYDMPLRFKFEDKILSGEGIDLEGRALQPGDVWTGPHPGIPYRLRAGGRDVYYRSYPRPHVEKRVYLSEAVGADAAAAFAQRIQRVKGWQGGRFYINEWREIFAPVTDGDDFVYLYIGHLEEHEPWFPKPSAPSE